jgi:hypothetical protein
MGFMFFLDINAAPHGTGIFDAAWDAAVSADFKPASSWVLRANDTWCIARFLDEGKVVSLKSFGCSVCDYPEVAAFPEKVPLLESIFHHQKEGSAA